MQNLKHNLSTPALWKFWKMFDLCDSVAWLLLSISESSDVLGISHTTGAKVYTE